MPEVLKKIQTDKGKGICVLPNWPTQSWYPKAMKMIIQQPVELRPRKDLLTLPSDPTQRHPLHARLRLLVCHLRLVFTSDGVVVGVVIRRIERYDLVKIKPSESEAEH